MGGTALADTSFDLAVHIHALRSLIDEALVQAIAADRTGSLYASMRYTLLSGGKRLRPILCLTCVDLLGGSLDAAMPTACGLEMLHTATLIHDDLPAMDDDDLRHGKAANHKVFGEGMALLAGDALLGYCLEFLLENTRGVDDRRLLRVIETIVRVVGAEGLTGGQAIDLELKGGDDVDVASLELMHSRKTGALIQASVATGAIIADADDAVLGRLVSYAGKIGLAYQIVDDVLDETGTSQTLGKPAGSDRDNGKRTFAQALGVPAAMRRARELAEGAKADLACLGSRAEPLHAIADYTWSRPS
jgi:geranylgeranyl diphosphate synthase, type II